MSVHTAQDVPGNLNVRETIKTGGKTFQSALHELKLRGEHRQFAALVRDADAPP